MSTASPKLSDAEILQLLQTAQEQYETYVKLAEISVESDEERPVYSWNNPIGLVINADVV